MQPAKFEKLENFLKGIPNVLRQRRFSLQKNILKRKEIDPIHGQFNANTSWPLNEEKTICIQNELLTGKFGHVLVIVDQVKRSTMKNKIPRLGCLSGVKIGDEWFIRTGGPKNRHKSGPYNFKELLPALIQEYYDTGANYPHACFDFLTIAQVVIRQDYLCHMNLPSRKSLDLFKNFGVVIDEDKLILNTEIDSSF